MTNPLNYPLEQLMTIKKNRFDQAVKILEEKKRLLAQAEEKLRQLQRDRDQVLEHKNAKLSQLREALDEGTTSDKIQQMKVYLKTVDEELAQKNKKVADGQKQVDAAKKQVEVATQEMFQKKKDLEKLEIHKKEWEKEVQYWTEKKEAAEADEQGSATHQVRKMDEAKRDRTRGNTDSGSTS